MPKLVLFISFLLTIQGSTLASQNEIQYTGRLDSQLTADRAAITLKCTAATAEDKSKLPASVSKDAQVFVGDMRWASFKKPGHKLLLIQDAGKPAYLLVDIDKNGEFTSEEKFSFTPYENMKEAESEGEVIIQFPMPNSAYKNYPVRLRHRKAAEKQEKEGVRYLSQSVETFATGTVMVEGRKTLVQYQVNS